MLKYGLDRIELVCMWINVLFAFYFLLKRDHLQRIVAVIFQISQIHLNCFPSTC